MKKIGLISDTHYFLDESVLHHLKNCDEVWHAGDIGHIKLLEYLQSTFQIRAVYGNIDGKEIRSVCKEYLFFTVDSLNFLIIHIAGKFGNYSSPVRDLIKRYKPNVLLCGHSHILKIAFDKAYNLLYINPGACGIYGSHPIRTLVRFEIADSQIKNVEVIELNDRHPKVNLFSQ